MAHWAELDENNIVLRVLVGDNNDPAGDEGYSWLIENLGGRWIKTSYNCIGGKRYQQLEKDISFPNGETYKMVVKEVTDLPHFRYNFAGIGFTYDEEKDAFIPPKPEEGNWILNEETCVWDIVE